MFVCRNPWTWEWLDAGNFTTNVVSLHPLKSLLQGWVTYWLHCAPPKPSPWDRSLLTPPSVALIAPISSRLVRLGMLGLILESSPTPAKKYFGMKESLFAEGSVPGCVWGGSFIVSAGCNPVHAKTWKSQNGCVDSDLMVWYKIVVPLKEDTQENQNNQIASDTEERMSLQPIDDYQSVMNDTLFWPYVTHTQSGKQYYSISIGSTVVWHNADN